MKPVKNFKEVIDSKISKNEVAYVVNGINLFIHYIDQFGGSDSIIDRFSVCDSSVLGGGDLKIMPNIVLIEIDWEKQTMRWYLRSKTSIKHWPTHNYAFNAKEFRTFNAFSHLVYKTISDVNFWKQYTTPIVL
jgi:hypothetical protein